MRGRSRRWWRRHSDSDLSMRSIEQKNVSVEADESWSTESAWIHMRDGIVVARNKYCHWPIVFTIGCKAFAALRLYSHENAFFFLACCNEHGSRLYSHYRKFYYYLLFGRFLLNDFSFWRNKIHPSRFILCRCFCWCVGRRTGRGTSTFWTLTTVIKLVTGTVGNGPNVPRHRDIEQWNGEICILQAIKKRKTV